MTDTLTKARALEAAARGECPPCLDAGNCRLQPCGYHCNYPYTDDATMWEVNCPTCHERRTTKARLTKAQDATWLEILEALAEVKCLNLRRPASTYDSRRCDKLLPGLPPCSVCAALAHVAKELEA